MSRRNVAKPEQQGSELIKVQSVDEPPIAVKSRFRNLVPKQSYRISDSEEEEEHIEKRKKAAAKKKPPVAKRTPGRKKAAATVTRDRQYTASETIRIARTQAYLEWKNSQRFNPSAAYCIICLMQMKTWAGSQNFPENKAFQFGLKENEVPEGARICNSCCQMCPVPTCPNTTTFFKRLRTIPWERWPLEKNTMAIILSELQITTDIMECCSTCYSQIFQRLGNPAGELAEIPQLWSEGDIEELKSGLVKNGTEWSKIAELLVDRTPVECRDFYEAHKDLYKLDELLEMHVTMYPDKEPGPDPNLRVCPVPTCPNGSSAVELRPINWAVWDYEPEYSNSVLRQFQITTALMECCSACYARIDRRLGSTNTAPRISDILQEEVNWMEIHHCSSSLEIEDWQPVFGWLFAIDCDLAVNEGGNAKKRKTLLEGSDDSRKAAGRRKRNSDSDSDWTPVTRNDKGKKRKIPERACKENAGSDKPKQKTTGRKKRQDANIAGTSGDKGKKKTQECFEDDELPINRLVAIMHGADEMVCDKPSCSAVDTAMTSTSAPSDSENLEELALSLMFSNSDEERDTGKLKVAYDAGPSTTVGKGMEPFKFEPCENLTLGWEFPNCEEDFKISTVTIDTTPTTAVGKGMESENTENPVLDWNFPIVKEEPKEGGYDGACDTMPLTTVSMGTKGFKYEHNENLTLGWEFPNCEEDLIAVNADATPHGTVDQGTYLKSENITLGWEFQNCEEDLIAVKTEATLHGTVDQGYYLPSGPFNQPGCDFEALGENPVQRDFENSAMENIPATAVQQESASTDEISIIQEIVAILDDF